MSTILLVATPFYGHVAPIVAIGRRLATSGHRIVLITGSRFTSLIEAAGLQHVPLADDADLDERSMATLMPDSDRYRGVALAQYGVERLFVRPIPAQWRAIASVLDTEPVDLVIADGSFVGIAPLLLRPRADRPPIIAVGVSPIPQVSRNTGPYNMALKPSWSPPGVLRNLVLNTLTEKVVFRRTQQLAERFIREAGGRASSRVPFVLDLSRLFDRYLELGPAEFEYPISDMNPQVRFVGPIDTTAGGTATPVPDWWDRLDDGRPVVHVTQGTLANADFGVLVRPALDGLADLDAHVVVSTGRAPLPSLGRLPDNALAAEFLPYDRLLPRTDVLVTNGGFGTVMLALAQGVPVVAAPLGEDKPEVAARIAWSGVGIDLRTGRPTPAQVRAAVVEVLGDPGFRRRARAMGTAIAGYSALEAIEEEVVASLSAAA